MRIERSALVGYSAAQMYELVRDVEAYPEFLSWCTHAEVHEEDNERQHATLTVSVAGIERRFSTVNYLEPGRRLGLTLEQGPFKSLSGEWRFQQLGETGSKILLELEFDFRPSLLSSAFQSGFKHIADRLVQDFCKRAEAIYGRAGEDDPDGR